MNIKIGKSGNSKVPYEVRWRVGDVLNRKRFKLKFDAVQFAEQLKFEHNIPDELRLDMSNRLDLIRIKAMCDNANISLPEVIGLISKQAENKSIGKSWSDAVVQYLGFCEHRRLRASTIRGYKEQLNLFRMRNNVQNIADVSPDMARLYLNNIISPEHSLRALRPFFAYCIEQNWLKQNPFAKTTTKKILKEKKMASVLPVERVAQFFKEIPFQHSPTFAMLLFAGVRPLELLVDYMDGKEVLKVGDVDFKNKTIRIRASVSKTRTERVLTHLPDNLWLWIESVRGRNPDENFATITYDQCRKIRRRFDVNQKDVFRHSFGSYGYHYLGAELTIEIMGHIGGFGTFAKHYKGLSNPETAKEFFAIVP